MDIFSNYQENFFIKFRINKKKKRKYLNFYMQYKYLSKTHIGQILHMDPEGLENKRFRLPHKIKTFGAKLSRGLKG